MLGSLELSGVLSNILHELGAAGSAGTETEEETDDAYGLPLQSFTEAVCVVLHVPSKSIPKSNLIRRSFVLEIVRFLAVIIAGLIVWVVLTIFIKIIFSLLNFRRFLLLELLILLHDVGEETDEHNDH